MWKKTVGPKTKSWQGDKWIVVALLLLGLGLRMAVLVRDPLHQDEALYGFWGRLIGSGQDAWLATVPVDKPPLHLYGVAASLKSFGASRFALRLPALAASLLSVAWIYALARRLYSGLSSEQVRWMSLAAAAVMALSPYPVLFGATGLTDAPLVLWSLVACYAAVAGGWGWAGVSLGLALATKQQALLLFVLPLGLGLQARVGRSLAPRGRGTGTRPYATVGVGTWGQAGLRFLLGLGGVGALVLGWEWARSSLGAASGFWQQGVISYGGLRLIWPAELAPRLRGWLSLLGYLWGWPLLGGLFVLGLVPLIWRALGRERATRPALTDLTLIFFTLFYLLAHWLLAFPVWDRYLLPLVPLLALLLGRLLSLGLARFGRRAGRLALGGLLFAPLLWTGLAAAAARVPVGGDHGAYAGLEPVVAHLRQLPAGTVLYDRWLSWHYDFYLFDAYLYRAGFPSLDWLATDLAAHYDGRPRYLVVPSWESSARMARQLGAVGFSLTPVLNGVRRDGSTSFTLYQINPTGG